MRAAILKAVIAAFGLFGVYTDAYAQQTQVLPDGTVLQGHLTVGQPTGTAAAPATTTCTLVAGSTDAMGQCAATATSGVAVTFAKAWAKAPFCVVLDHTTASGNALATEPNTTTFVMGTTVSGDKISWWCVGQPGN